MSAATRPLTIAVLAVGGQGGGVLSGWLLALAENNGWRVQTTSVPGVAQRTGATVYYIEMAPEEGPEPVFALMPSPASVDLVVAAELMEAGRAIQRGLVSPARTVMLASDHRSYAVVEKAQPGNGAADPEVVLQAAREASKRFLHADMSAIAEQHRSAISASLFGAIAAAGVLPFEREAFEATIRAGGVGVEASLAAFAGGYGALNTEAAAPPPAEPDEPSVSLSGGTEAEQALYRQLRERLGQAFPGALSAQALAGLNAVIDFQDAAYGSEYLERLEALRARSDDPDFALAAARYLAQAMVYDDVIRVADLKTRHSRFERVREAARAEHGDLVHSTEFFHPRVEELCSTLPPALGRAVERGVVLKRIASWLTGSGRRIRTDRLHGFLLLHAVAGLRRWRRAMLRHERETAHIEAWLDSVHDLAASDVALATEVLRCRRLVKGYSDTHARGQSKFDRLMSVVPRLAQQVDGALQLAALLEVAVRDETGAALDDAIGALHDDTRKAA